MSAWTYSMMWPMWNGPLAYGSAVVTKSLRGIEREFRDSAIIANCFKIPCSLSAVSTSSHASHRQRRPRGALRADRPGHGAQLRRVEEREEPEGRRRPRLARRDPRLSGPRRPREGARPGRGAPREASRCGPCERQRGLEDRLARG